MILSNHLSLKALAVALVISPILVFTSAPLYAKGFYGAWDEAEKYIIFLDPAHGGQDLGSRGASSMLEKNITLKLANLLKKRLSKDERIEVRFSRTDDINLGAIERIDMANTMRANLFIGIHTDGGMTPRSHPMMIFIWGEDEDIDTLENVEPNDKKRDSVPWSHLQVKKAGESQELADVIENRLRELDPKRGVNIVQTDRMLIGGLTMPAVIVEALDLSNPQDEIKLQDMKYLEEMSNKIVDAIYDYLRDSEDWE